MNAIPELPVWDKVGLMARLMDDAELLAPICAAFLSQTPQQITNIAHFIVENDLLKASRVAHLLRGACATIGTECLRQLAGQIETACEQGNQAEARLLAADLPAAFALVQRCMAEIRP